MRTRIKLGVALLSIIVVAALAYWVAWQRRPDLFVVQQEVNLYPFGSLEAFIWSDNNLQLPSPTSALTEVAVRASKLISTAKQLRKKETELMAEIYRLESEMTEALKELEKNRTERIEEFRQRELEPFERERSIIENRLATLEARLNPNSNEYDPLRVVVADLRVELAKHNLKQALKRVEVADRILKEYGQFAKPEDVKRWHQLDNGASNTRNGLIKAARERMEIRQSTFDLLAELRAERVNRLGLLDFLYFSIGVSTTTTFGDIIPNHTITRAIVATQLLLSILIVGLFINSIRIV